MGTLDQKPHLMLPQQVKPKCRSGLTQGNRISIFSWVVWHVDGVVGFGDVGVISLGYRRTRNRKMVLKQSRNKNTCCFTFCGHNIILMVTIERVL